jgi:BirA family biotin operon repressor/biotin-[acetyl-CoA-carboxylase] ligase
MREKIISILKKNSGFVSGEELSRQLNMSRAGIWKHIEDLRRQGYVIKAVPHSGYRLVSSPDKLLPWEIQSGLATQYIGKEIFCQDTIPSTMDEAVKLATSGAREGVVVCADSQTKGRGRMGRSWVSPKGKGVYFSVILRPMLPLNEVAKLTLMSAVAVCEALRDISGVDIKIKWPNDLLVGQKKIVGILTELNAEVDRVKFVVVGVGVNVNTASRQLPEIATSLKMEAGRDFSRVQVLQMILKNLEKEQVKKQGFVPVLKKWKQLSLTLGQRVSVEDAGKKLEGVAIDLADDGGLLIQDSQGKIIKRMSGDVFTLKR